MASANAQVTVGKVSITDEGANFINAPDANVPTDYQISNKYYFDSGALPLPVASPGGFQGASISLVNLCAPTLLWVCDWTCCQIGQQPEIPSLKPIDSNWVLLFAAPETMSVAKTGDGAGSVYRISGRQVYQHLKPTLRLYDFVRFGRPPYFSPGPDIVQPAGGITQTQGLADGN